MILRNRIARSESAQIKKDEGIAMKHEDSIAASRQRMPHLTGSGT